MGNVEELFFRQNWLAYRSPPVSMIFVHRAHGIQVLTNTELFGSPNKHYKIGGNWKEIVFSENLITRDLFT